MDQPRAAELLRTSFHQLHAQGLAGDPVEGGDADGRPRHGTILDRQRPSGCHDSVHHRQVCYALHHPPHSKINPNSALSLVLFLFFFVFAALPIYLLLRDLATQALNSPLRIF